MMREITAEIYNENDELVEVTAIVDEGSKGITRYGIQETPDDEPEVEIIDSKLADGAAVTLSCKDEANALEAIFEAYRRY